MKNRISVQKGLTLVELMISMTLSLIVIFAVGSILISSNQAASVSDTLADSQETGRFAVDYINRQLLRTGWMHNRVRMITAAFLSKLMLIDWHLGEQFFYQHLIDGDFASNNGGWQWSASVGADAAPYFRIFNPYRQAERFDPKGDYVRRFVPELASLSDKDIHQPSKQQCHALGYPEPIINYKMAREEAMATFAKAFKGEA